MGVGSVMRGLIGMITNRPHKVAVATIDGKTLAEHFGSAPLFVVCTVENGKVVEREMRQNRLECRGGSGTRKPGCWELMESLLPDVRVVICRGMGENAYVGLLRRDVLPVTVHEEDIERALEAYLKGNLQEDPRLVHDPRRGRGKRRADSMLPESGAKKEGGENVENMRG